MEYLSVPFLPDFSDHSLSWVLVGSFGFADLRFDLILPQLSLKLGVLSDLFVGTIADKYFHRTVFIDEQIQWLVSVSFSFSRIRWRKDLAVVITVDGLASHIHRICRKSPL